MDSVDRALSFPFFFPGHRTGFSRGPPAAFETIPRISSRCFDLFHLFQGGESYDPKNG